MAKPIIQEKLTSENVVKSVRMATFTSMNGLRPMMKRPEKPTTISQKLKGKIKSGTQEIVSTRPKKNKGKGGLVLMQYVNIPASRTFWNGSGLGLAGS